MVDVEGLVISLGPWLERSALAIVRRLRDLMLRFSRHPKVMDVILLLAAF